jgi:hypothetical protein
MLGPGACPEPRHPPHRHRIRAGKLPQLGKGLGDGIKNFKDAVKSGTEGSDAAKDKKDTPAK